MRSNITDRQIITSRLFDATPEQMFAAWSDPGHLTNWWGPNGFTNTFHTFDFQEGGIWDFTMHSPDGLDYPNKNRFSEIVDNERIVFDHLEPVHSFQVTAVFTPEENKTRFTFRMLFDSADECQRVGQFIQTANEENFDRLEKELLTMYVSS
jgi:uncharacterized protein YndB with AHSA1/START domain